MKTTPEIDRIDEHIEATQVRLKRLRAERRIAVLRARERELVKGGAK